MFDEVQVARAVDLGECDVQPLDLIGRCSQRAERTALQFGQHMIQAPRRFMARYQPAAEHLVPTLVQVMLRVVNDLHARAG